MLDLTQTGNTSITVERAGEVISVHQTWHRAVVSAYAAAREPGGLVEIVTNQRVRVTITSVEPKPIPTGVTSDAPTTLDASTVIFSDSPWTITAGGTYTGLRISAADGQDCVEINTNDIVIFEDCIFQHSDGDAIYAPGGTVAGYAANPRLEFRHCRFFGEFPTTEGESVGRAIDYRSGKRLIVENCHLQRGRIYAYQHSAAAADVLQVRYNTAVNIDGRHVDASGNPTSTKEQQQFFQHNGRAGIAGVFEVAWNEVWNTSGESGVEDVINLFATGGTAANPVLVHHNLFNGMYPPVMGTGYSGGGIMLADGPGDYAYAIAEYNTVMASANYGIAIAGGDHHTIRNNRVFRTGLLPNGVSDGQGGTGPAAYVNNYGDSTLFGDHTVQDNVWRWQDDDVNSTNNTWWPSPGPNFTETGNTDYATVIDQDFIDAEVVAWREAAIAAGLTIGPHS